jgi:AraC family transcriptional regulator
VDPQRTSRRALSQDGFPCPSRAPGDARAHRPRHLRRRIGARSPGPRWRSRRTRRTPSRGRGSSPHLFVASEGKAGREITRRLFSGGPIAPIPTHTLGDLPARLKATFEDPHHTDDDLRALGRDLTAHLAGDHSQATTLDPRIAKSIAWVATRVDDAVSLSEVAALVGLSPGSHPAPLRAADGAPLSHLPAVAAAGARGRAVSSAVRRSPRRHGAGFADSAHLSRTFRRMFGIAAVTLQVS